eukprot:PITA_05789
MGIWPTEKALHVWIRSHRKPKGEITLHLGSKGFFTMVFTSLEDKDRVFEGGPYFYATAGLYMQPWMMNFIPKRETFTLVPVWIRFYSLPLDYWLSESLKTISNKLGHFINISDVTLKGKYTSFAKICVEMDLSRALPDAIILEVDCSTNKMERNVKITTDKNPQGFTKVEGKGKGRKWQQKKIDEDRQPSQNVFKIPEEEVENKGTNYESEITPTEKERDASMEDMTENS